MLQVIGGIKIILPIPKVSKHRVRVPTLNKIHKEPGYNTRPDQKCDKKKGKYTIRNNIQVGNVGISNQN